MSKTTIPTGGITDAAVTTAKITDANISTAKLADDAVTDAKLGTLTQITFNSTQSASSNVNTLDDYEEGTWSPALGNFGGSNETFVAPRYTKVGRLVTVSCQLQIGSFSSDSSNFLLTGLPFTCKNEGGTTFGTVPFRQTNTSTMGLTIGDNNTQMEMYAIPSGGQFNYNDFGQYKTMAFVAQNETA